MMMNHKKYSYKHSLAPFYLKKFNVNLFQFKKIKKIYNVNASFLHIKLTCIKKTATTIFSSDINDSQGPDFRSKKPIKLALVFKWDPSILSKGQTLFSYYTDTLRIKLSLFKGTVKEK